INASPIVLSTRPPWLVTSVARRANHEFTRFFTCSGSRVSDSPVKPTMSAKSTVTTRLSSPRAARACPQDGTEHARSGAAAAAEGHVTDSKGTGAVLLRVETE